MSKNIAAVVGKMVSELEGLKSAEERERAFAGARAVLGMTNAGDVPPGDSGQVGSLPPIREDAKIVGISSSGAAWIKRSGLSDDRINEYYHVDNGKVALIGEAIGKSKREQTINTYILTGVAALLEGGKPDFADKTAREYCTSLGCYDSTNHAFITTQFGNQITGSKKAGWKLTAPGLSAAAVLLKSVAQDNK